MTRDSIIQEVLEGSKDFKYSQAQIATGVGKTKLALHYIDMHLNSGKVLWLVPMTSLISNVADEITKWGFEHILDRITIVCYASMDDYLQTGNMWDVLILDEAHNSVSLKRLNALSRKNYWKCLALSATISSEVSELLDTLGIWHKVKVTLEDAIEADILAEPEVIVKYLDLDDTKAIYPYKYKTGERLLTAKNYYETLSSSITYFRNLYESEGAVYAGNKMKQLGSSRMRWLAQYKESYVVNLLEELGEERLICFCGSVEQAKRLGGKNVCSSDLTKKGNAKLIDDFNSGLSNKLYAKNMLQEGINLSNVSKAIIVQLGNGERQFVQSAGRCLRSKDNPTIYLFIVKNTVDERFLKNSTQSNSALLK